MKLKIDQILEKYWDAETSVEEERMLREYFSSSEIHPDHAPFSSLFGYYHHQCTQVMPSHISLSKPKVVVMSLRTWLYAAAAVST